MSSCLSHAFNCTRCLTNKSYWGLAMNGVLGCAYQESEFGHSLVPTQVRDRYLLQLYLVSFIISNSPVTYYFAFCVQLRGSLLRWPPFWSHLHSFRWVTRWWRNGNPRRIHVNESELLFLDTNPQIRLLFHGKICMSRILVMALRRWFRHYT